MSSGCPTRATGICEAAPLMKSSNAMPMRSAVALVISVWMNPGATALAVTPNLPSSMARVLVKPCRPALAAEELTWPRLPSAETLERFTIRPHLASIMYFCTARVMRNAPRRCTFMTTSQSVSVILNSMLSRVTPALLISTVGAPSSAATRSTAACTWSASLTSAPTASARPPAASIAWTVSLPAASSRSRTATANPSCASRRAVAAPMPRAAPVTMATRVPALASLMNVPFQSDAAAVAAGSIPATGRELRPTRYVRACGGRHTVRSRRVSGPDRGDDDRRDRHLDGGADQAGRVELGLHQVLPQSPGEEHVQRDERHGLEHDPEDAEDDGVEERPAEPAGGVGPDGGEDDRALPEEAPGEGDGGVERAVLRDVPAQVSGGEQIEGVKAQDQERDAHPGVGGGEADALQHGVDLRTVREKGLPGLPHRPLHARTGPLTRRPDRLHP